MKMIKLLFISLLFSLMFANYAFAQKGFKMGVHVSTNFSRPTQLDSISRNFQYRFNTGFGAGLLLDYGIKKNKGISLGFTYIEKGYRINNDTNSLGKNIKMKTKNYEIPIGINFRQNVGSGTFFRETFGLGFNFVADKYDSVVLYNKKDGGNFRVEQVRSVSFYPLFHMGIEYGTSTNNGNMFLFGINYKQGLGRPYSLNIYSSGISTPLFPMIYRGGYLSVGVTYLFNFQNVKKDEEFFTWNKLK